MFRKKECQNCRKKIKDKSNFCSNCGYNFSNKQKQEDWGMLGETDASPFMNDLNLPLGFNTIFNSLMKNLDKQFKQMEREVEPNNQNMKNNGISISISTSGNAPPEIRVNHFGKPQNSAVRKVQPKKIPQMQLSPENRKKLLGLPKKEPLTNMKRLSDRILYEINIPGVDSLKDVSIAKLENSIEVKAIGNEFVYSKILPINLPIVNYDLSDGILVLELGVK